MSHYPGFGAHIDEASEETAATNLLNKNCQKEFDSLRSYLLAYEQDLENNAQLRANRETLQFPKFSAAETLDGHQKYARDQIRWLIRYEHLVDCWRYKALDYVRGTSESAESILAASLLACAEDRERLRAMSVTVYFGDADAKLDEGIKMARDQVTKLILDERLKSSKK